MNYVKIYDSIIDRAKNRANTKQEANKLLGYSEKHHIIPKCMGGLDVLDNICYLSAREHFIAHFLLVKIYPSNFKLVYACHRLATSKQGEMIKSSKMFEFVKILNSNVRKTLNKSNCDHIKKQSQKMTGRTKENNESVRKMAETKTGRTKENNESVRKMAETKTGRTKETYPGLKLMSEKKSKLSIDTKIKLVELKDQGYSIQQIKSWVNDNFPEYVEVSISGLYKTISNTKKYLKNSKNV